MDYKTERFLLLAKHGVIESNNESGDYDIQRIDNHEEYAVESELDFIPPLLRDDNEAKMIFKSLGVRIKLASLRLSEQWMGLVVCVLYPVYKTFTKSKS